MAPRVTVALTLLTAIVRTVAPDAVPGNGLTILLVLLGLAYPVLAKLDAEDATSHFVVVLAFGASAESDVLNVIPAVGMYPGRHTRRRVDQPVCDRADDCRHQNHQSHQGLTERKPEAAPRGSPPQAMTSGTPRAGPAPTRALRALRGYRCSAGRAKTQMTPPCGTSLSASKWAFTARCIPAASTPQPDCTAMYCTPSIM